METLTEVKEKIVREFAKRTNDSVRGKIDFNKNIDVLNAIAKTYLYYARNFPEKIDPDKIDGVDRVERVLNKSKPITMSELYLDRLLLNMLEVGETKDAKGLVEDHAVLFNKSSMDKQISYWKQKGTYFKDNVDLLKGKEDVVQDNLNAKVVVHELSHMSAIATVNAGAGFYSGSTQANKQTYASRFEEICAEATALNVTGQKIPAYTSYMNDNIKVEIGGYNPESSNYAISSFIELAPFAFGRNNLETGRMMNPEGFIQELNLKHSRFAKEGGTFAGRIQEDLKAITDKNELSRLPKLQADFIKIGMERLTKIDYLNKCDERQFKQDIGFLLRLKPLLYTRYVDNQLQQTENIVIYDKAMMDISKIYDLLRTKRGMLQQYGSFEDFLSEGNREIENAKRESLGIKESPVQSQKLDVSTQSEIETPEAINVEKSYTGSSKPPHIDTTQVVTDNSKNATNSDVSIEKDKNLNNSNQPKYTYKTIDTKTSSIGVVSKQQHYDNVKYQFICETINNLFGNNYTGLCAIKPKDTQNIEIIERARRVWQAMAYDNGMRIVNDDGKEISVRDMLRKYYREDGFRQEDIPNRILLNNSIPNEIRSLFEDLYVSRGLSGMAEIIENDVDLAISRNPNNVISEAIHSYTGYEPKQWMTISEYDNQCKRGDIQYETAKYLQQNYNFLGGYNDSSFEEREYAKGSQEILLSWLSKSLDMAKNRTINLNETKSKSI